MFLLIAGYDTVSPGFYAHLNTSHVLINHASTIILFLSIIYLNTSHVLINPTFLRIFLFISYLISLDFSTFLHFFTSRHPLSHISVIFLFFPRFYGMFPVFPIYAAWQIIKLKSLHFPHLHFLKSPLQIHCCSSI